MTRFHDRAEAGRALAAALAAEDWPDPVVLALPRGGVPVAVEVARALGAPLDLVMVRKIGAPGQPELAVGAVVDGATPRIVTNPGFAAQCGPSPGDVDAMARRELAEIARRRALYLRGCAPVPLAGRTAIAVDDGVATGATMRAALRALRRPGPARLVLAVPVAPRDTAAALQAEVDALVCLHRPTPFGGVGAHYDLFPQIPDAEVARLIARADRAAAYAHDMPGARE